MSELRIKLLDLAIQAGATIENATKVATDWEQWATEDDPLRLGVPDVNVPMSDRLMFLIGEFENYPSGTLIKLRNSRLQGIECMLPTKKEAFLDISDPALLLDDTWYVQAIKDADGNDVYVPIEMRAQHDANNEIDWGRPQLVHLIDEPDFIVRTTGLVGFDEFQGYSDADGDVPDWYKKKRFEYHGEIEEPKNPGKTEQEIDWSRPQLVINLTNKRIIRTTGKHDDDTFSGSVIEAGSGVFGIGESVDNWFKSVYEYHGEIPKEASIFNQEAFTMSDMQRCFNESRLTHPMTGFKHDNFNDYLKWLKIPQEQQEESRTTGLNFLEAITACNAGRNIARTGWASSAYLYQSDTVLYWQDGEEVQMTTDNFLATDWKIVAT